jgi:hypothetical protein
MTFLNEQGPLCDACVDERISAATGWPRLPAPPPPRTVTGPDGRDHRLRFRLWRTPGGISVDAIEQGPRGDTPDGYTLSVHGDHDADPAVLLTALEQRVRAETGRCYLEHDDQSGWQVTGTHVAGRLHGDQDDAPDVIIDGRRITWTDFGRMIASFDGWWFRMTFGDDDVPATTAPPGSPDHVAYAPP